MPTNYENRISGLGPVIWLKLDGSGAPTSSGSSTPTFTLSGTAPTTGVSSSISNTAYTFGGNGYYSVGALPANTLSDRNFSIEAWIKMNPSSIDYPTIYRADNGANGIFLMRVRGNNIATPGVAEVYFKGASTAITLQGTTRVDDNAWHHIAFRSDATNGFYSLFVDGKIQATSVTSPGTVTDIDTAGTRYFGSGGVSTENFSGTIDEFAIFSNIPASLNNGQIAGNYYAGLYPNSMQAKINSYSPEYYWQGDVADAATVTWHTYGSGNDRTDWTRTTTSPSANITRVASTLPTSTGNPFMLSIPYASRYRTLATVYSSTEATDLDFVVGVWFKQNTSSSNAVSLTKILGTTGSVFDMTMYSSTHADNPGRLLWTTAGIAGVGTVRVDDGNWHFLSIRKVTGNNNYLCYVDGVLDRTNTTASSMTAGNWQVGDSTQGSGSATIYLDSFFIASSGNVTATNLLDIYNHAFPAATNGGYTAEVMTVTTSTFPDPVITAQDNNNVNETPATASALAVDPVVSTDLSYEFNASALLVTDSTLVGPSVQTDASTEISAAEMTASSEFPQPTLSTTNNIEFAAGALTASAEFVNPTNTTEVIFTTTVATASSEFSPTTGLIIDDGYEALPGTASCSFSLVDPVITADKNASFSASPMTANATADGHTRYLRTFTFNVTNDRARGGAQEDTTLSLYNPNDPPGAPNPISNANYASIVFDAIPSYLVNPTVANNIISANLKVTIASLNAAGPWSSGTASNLSYFRIDAPWNETQSATIGVAPSYTAFANGGTYTPTAINESFNVNIKQLMTSWLNGTYPNYGLTVYSPENTPHNNFFVYSSEVATTDYRPVVTLVVDIGPDNLLVDGQPMLASALMSDPNIIQGQGDDNLAVPALASALAVLPAISGGTGVTVALTPADHLEAFANLIPDPTVTTEQGNQQFANAMTASGIFAEPVVAAFGMDANVNVAAFNANASLPMPGIRQDDGAVANTMVALNATFVDPSVAADTIELVFAEPMLMSFFFLPPDEAVDETQDPYYQEILKTTNLYDSAWYRLDEISGSTVVSKTKEINASNLQQNASFVGTPVFGNVGPRVRKTITFTGSQYISVPNPFGATGVSGNIDWLGAASTQVTEITLKTIQSKGTILYGTDANTLAGAGNPIFWMLDLVDGRLRFRTGVVFRDTHLVVPNGVVIGNKQINDGEFHHIAIQLGNVINGKQLEIYVDGDLDIARFNVGKNQISAHPDFIAGDGVPTRLFAYNTISYIPGNLEETPYFAGEIMEYVFRPNTTLTEYQIEQLYYRALDIDLKPFQTVTATATMPEPIVSGNKPKALILSFASYTRNGVFDENLEVTHQAGGFDPDAFDVWEYWVNRQTINPQKTSIGQIPATGAPLRDPVTDDVVMLDPRTIPNIARYDIIQINGYPLDSNDVSNLLSGYDDGNYQGNLKRLENFVDQVREIVDTYGTSLLVTNPRLAVDLGIVDDVEYMNPFYDQVYTGAQTRQNSGIFDPRSQQINLQNDLGSLPQIGGGSGWWDTHGNNRLRITATQAGLTDIPNTWMLQEVTNFIPGDPLQIERTSYKYKDTRNTGLIIGDSMPIINRQISPNESFGEGGNVYNRVPAKQPIIAFPPNSVKAGTIIAKMGTTYWDQATERANPYADYAAAIVVNPGTNVKGRTLGGKIYVGCAEWIDTSYANMATFQTTNGDPNNPIIPDNSAWQYSGFRLSTTGTQVGAGADQVTVTPGQVQQRAGQRTTTILDAAGNPYTVSYGGSQLFSIIVEEQYPTVNVWAPSLLERAIYWLADRPDVNPSDKTVRPQAFVAEMLMVDPALNINRDRVVSAAAMISNADIVEPDEVNAVDANIVTLPLTATALINGYSRFISAPVMTATATITGNSITFAGGEQVVVTLHELPMVEVFIKEDTY